MNKKFDLRGNMTAFMQQSESRATDRFAAAEAIIQSQPSGTAPARDDAATEVGAGHLQRRSDETSSDATSVIAPIVNVHDNPLNARKFYDPDILKERAASLAKDGQMTPAPAVRDPKRPGHYILLGGHYRKRGLLIIGKTHMALKLLEATSDLDMYRLSYAENDQRANATPMDDAVAWNDLLNRKIVSSHDEIAEVTGKPRTTIAKTVSLLKLPPSVLEILKERPRQFTLTAGYMLTLLAEKLPVAILEKHAKAVADGELSTRELDAIKAKLTTSATPRTREVSRPHRILHGGEEIGVIKDWDSGKITFEANIADARVREQVVARLQDMLSAELERVKGSTTP
jgi:ParB family transcriptional regulator, chromosome partitioning protein